jgi:hypothetical protein
MVSLTLWLDIGWFDIRRRIPIWLSTALSAMLDYVPIRHPNGWAYLMFGKIAFSIIGATPNGPSSAFVSAGVEVYL